MKILIIILILASFLQATILPLDLVLIILVLRAYIKAEAVNLYLAFFFGLLASLLTFTPFGLSSMIYLILVTLTQILSKSRLASHIFTTVPVVLVMLTLSNVSLALLSGESVQLWPKIVIEAVIILPIYIGLKIWEERFVVKDIKLRL